MGAVGVVDTCRTRTYPGDNRARACPGVRLVRVQRAGGHRRALRDPELPTNTRAGVAARADASGTPGHVAWTDRTNPYHT